MSQDESVEVEHNYLGSIQLKPRDPQPYYQLSNFDWNFVLDVYTVVLVVLRTCKEYDVTNNVDITKFTENGLTQGKFRYADIPYDFGNDLVYFKVSLSPKNFIYSNLIRITNNDIDKTVRIDYVDNTREGNEEYKQSTRVNLYKHNHVANTEIDAYYQISTEQNVNSRIQENSLQEWYMPPINAWTFKRIEKAFYNGGFWLDLVRNYLTSPLEYVERQELSNVSEQMFTTDPNEDDILNVIEVEIESNPIPMLSSTSVKSSTSHLSSEVLTYGDDVEAFTYRVEADGGIVESTECINDTITAPFHFQPSGYKEDVAYVQKPNDGLADFTLARVGEQSRHNKDGDLEFIPANTPVYDYSVIDGCPVLSLPPQSTNEYLDSELNNVENTTVTATPWTVSLYGTGTITFSGAYVGSLVGTGVNDRVDITFTPTAGVLVSTDSGSVNQKQIENRDTVTPYIKTIGAPETRYKNMLTLGGNVNTFNSEEGYFYIERNGWSDTQSPNYFSLSDGTISNRIAIYFHTDRIRAFIETTANGVKSFSNKTGIVANQFYRILITWDSTGASFWVDGTEIDNDPTMSGPVANTFDRVNNDAGNGSSVGEAEAKVIQVGTVKLTDQQAEDLTTNGYL